MRYAPHQAKPLPAEHALFSIIVYRTENLFNNLLNAPGTQAD